MVTFMGQHRTILSLLWLFTAEETKKKEEYNPLWVGSLF